MKTCTKCGETKPVAEFPVRKDRGSRPRSHCRPCHNAAAKTPRSKALQRAWRYQAKYGITVERFDEMMRAQRGRCAICPERIDESSANVDHDHATGAVRALLCGPCNRGLGAFVDDPARLRAAAAYVEQHQAPTVSFPAGPKRLDLPLAG